MTRQARRMDSQGEQLSCMGLSSATTDSNYYMTVETRFILVTVSTGADPRPAGSICPHSFHVNDVYVLMCLSILYLPGLTQCSHSHRSPHLQARGCLMLMTHVSYLRSVQEKMNVIRVEEPMKNVVFTIVFTHPGGR